MAKQLIGPRRNPLLDLINVVNIITKDFPKILNSKGEKSMEQTRTNKFGNSKRQGIYTLNDNPGPGQ